MNVIETFFSVIEKLEAAEIPYMVVGSVASMTYGQPRLTHDMDLVIDIPAARVQVFEELFTSEDFYCPPPEVMRTEVVQRGQFNLIHHETGLKIDIMIRKTTAHAESEFLRRGRVPFWADRAAFFAAPEDVIIKKLEYYRQGGSEKHLQDIRGVLAETQIDMNYLRSWVEELGLCTQWQEV